LRLVCVSLPLGNKRVLFIGDGSTTNEHLQKTLAARLGINGSKDLCVVSRNQGEVPSRQFIEAVERFVDLLPSEIPADTGQGIELVNQYAATNASWFAKRLRYLAAATAGALAPPLLFVGVVLGIMATVYYTNQKENDNEYNVALGEGAVPLALYGICVLTFIVLTYFVVVSLWTYLLDARTTELKVKGALISTYYLLLIGVLLCRLVEAGSEWVRAFTEFH
jgi:hypothetical protein